MADPDRRDEHPPAYVGAYDVSSSDSEDEDEEPRSSDFGERGRRRHQRGGRRYESVRLQRMTGTHGLDTRVVVPCGQRL